MFEQLMETQPQGTEVKNRKTYFMVSAAVMGITLFTALIISLFAIDLNIGMNDSDMVELVAPVDVQPEVKRPELETEPKQLQKAQAPGGSSSAPTRQVIMARVDETPREVPPAVSAVQNTAKARPLSDYTQFGKADSDPVSGAGSGRGTGDGNGSGNGLGDGIGDGDGTLAAASDNPVPPPPVKKAPEAPQKPIVQSMGVVNGRATSLPLPTIPAAAKAVNVAGTVSVQVLIDENGKVVSANAVSGNPLLREASEVAARNAKFSKTLLSGTPVKVSGIINYHFSSDSAE